MDQTHSDPDATTAQPGSENLSKDIAFDNIIFTWSITAICIAGVLFLLLIPIFLVYYYNAFEIRKDPPMVVVTMIAGALGGFFSVTTRIYHLKVLSAGVSLGELKTIQQKHLVVYLLIPTATGCISAIVLYTAFAGGLIQGDLFPKFHCKGEGSNEACDTFRKTVDLWTPIEAKDFCKVMIWGFIAGFVERFVPDMLGTINKSHPAG